MTSISLNVGNFITLKLNPTNYPLLCEQILALAESQDLVGRLTNEDSTPTQFTTPDPNNTTNSEQFVPKITDEFVKWRKADCLIRGWIMGTLSEEALGLVVGIDIAHAVWSALKDAYAEDSQEREFTLRQQMTCFRKEENQTISEHIRIFKGLCDNLAAIGKPIPDKEKVFYLLTSLDPDYETFTTTIHNNMQNSITPQMAFYGRQQQRSRQNSSQGQGNSQTFTSTGRGFHAQQPSNQNKVHPTLTTQQCRPPPPGERRMTPAERERYRNDKSLTLDNTIVETKWTSDTGASNHMTGTTSMLSNIRRYSGTDYVLIGDGSSLPIHGTRNGGTSDYRETQG
ncbi:hypothetical protein TSUD_238280 [Trifolium subterraneum]|uniref:Retrovirus-related Pol polyprotein from transposon TNT 1-94-like beta-barrel domain-containing protein n=1 Tax=Trifolium subterraneum TaxID=3900 RepID=A0A2Z6PMU5_TRISU|nr:hypothetical protein TSUD_238280 [Trifolium subterraneum]